MRGFLRRNKGRIRGDKSGENPRSSPFFAALKLFRLHPLFLIVGVWYAFTGELFLFFISALVAVQHECAHAFAAAKLGYRLNAIILMPFGAIIDGDLRGISFKDEIYVALCGPLCNLCTAIFFVAWWWFNPTMYAFTDTACYSSLSIALVNLLPAYPLDGGRILQCALARIFQKSTPQQAIAEKKARRICKTVTLFLSTAALGAFALQCSFASPNFTLLAFGGFLFVGALGNKKGFAVYEKMNFSLSPNLKKGVEVRRVAISQDCPIKDALRFVARGSYLVLEVYNEKEERLFDLHQNELSELFLRAETPYQSVIEAYHRKKNQKNG